MSFSISQSGYNLQTPKAIAPSHHHRHQRAQALLSQNTSSLGTPLAGTPLQTQFSNPLRHKRQAQRIMAGAQHDRLEPRNPIPFNDLDNLLKTVEPQIHPKTGSVMGKGYPGGLNHLLRVGNRIIANMNHLADQGHQDVELVVYLDDGQQTKTQSVRDPFSGNSIEYEVAPDPKKYCVIPTPMKLNGKFSLFSHWATIAEKQHPGLEYLEFSKQELQELKDAAHNQRTFKPEHRFNLNHKNQLADYAEQLFQMLKNVEFAKDEMPAIWQDPDASHYKVGLISKTPQGQQTIQDISRLFPGCDLDKVTSNSVPTPPLSLKARTDRDFLEQVIRLDLNG